LTLVTLGTTFNECVYPCMALLGGAVSAETNGV
jgi:hypothetical protein